MKISKSRSDGLAESKRESMMVFRRKIVDVDRVGAESIYQMDCRAVRCPPGAAAGCHWRKRRSVVSTGVLCDGMSSDCTMENWML